MASVIFVRPANLVGWLSETQRKENLLLLSFSATPEDDSTLRLELNVVFNPLAVRRGVLTRYNYYVASTGAEIEIELEHGDVRSHTNEATLSVEYENASEVRRKKGAEIAPSLQVKNTVDTVDATR